MEQMRVLTLKVDNKKKVLDYNNNFMEFFNLKDHNIRGYILSDVLNICDLCDDNILQEVLLKKDKTTLLVRNHVISRTETEKTAIVMLYSRIIYVDDCYIIKMANFLNWIYNITNSKESSYNTMVDLNKLLNKTNFESRSNATCFKALYPLLLHNSSNYKVNNLAIYDTMRNFVGRKDNEEYEKDYPRKVISRIKTSLKRDFGLIDMELKDLVRNNKLINIYYKGDICIPNTKLNHNIVFSAHNDQLLNYMMKINDF